MIQGDHFMKLKPKSIQWPENFSLSAKPKREFMYTNTRSSIFKILSCPEVKEDSISGIFTERSSLLIELATLLAFTKKTANHLRSNTLEEAAIAGIELCDAVYEYLYGQDEDQETIRLQITSEFEEAFSALNKLENEAEELSDPILWLFHQGILNLTEMLHETV